MCRPHTSTHVFVVTNNTAQQGVRKAAHRDASSGSPVVRPMDEETGDDEPAHARDHLIRRRGGMLVQAKHWRANRHWTIVGYRSVSAIRAAELGAGLLTFKGIC
jgi:hypothetical protein